MPRSETVHDSHIRMLWRCDWCELQQEIVTPRHLDDAGSVARIEAITEMNGQWIEYDHQWFCSELCKGFYDDSIMPRS